MCSSRVLKGLASLPFEPAPLYHGAAGLSAKPWPQFMEPLEERFFSPSLKNPMGRKSSTDIIAVRFIEIFGKIYIPTYQCRLRAISSARSSIIRKGMRKIHKLCAKFKPV
jgi:hypothetical protein